MDRETTEYIDELRATADEWQRLAIELATIVNAHEKGRMINDKKAAWKLAREILDKSKGEKNKSELSIADLDIREHNK